MHFCPWPRSFCSSYPDTRLILVIVAMVALSRSILRLCLVLLAVVQSKSDQCEGAKSASAVLLQASTAANRTLQASTADHTEAEVAERIEQDLEDIEDSLAERARARGDSELELEDAVQGKNSRRRRSRRRTTTTTTTVNCGSSTDSYSLAFTIYGGSCLEGPNTGGAASLDTASCSTNSNNRDQFLFVDQGDGYCTLQSKYGTRRRSASGKSVTCGTSSMSVAYCKAQGSQSYTKLKLEDLGNDKFTMWWYDSSGNVKQAKRGAGGIKLADYTNTDEPDFKLYKNTVYSSTCLLSKNDLGLSCWK